MSVTVTPGGLKRGHPSSNRVNNGESTHGATNAPAANCGDSTQGGRRARPPEDGRNQDSPVSGVLRASWVGPKSRGHCCASRSDPPSGNSLGHVGDCAFAGNVRGGRICKRSGSRVLGPPLRKTGSLLAPLRPNRRDFGRDDGCILRHSRARTPILRHASNAAKVAMGLRSGWLRRRMLLLISDPRIDDALPTLHGLAQ
jgi:hypothetical protein